MIFCGDTGVIIKVRRLLEEALSSGLLGTPTPNKEPAQNVIPEQPKEKKRRTEEASISEIWIQCSGIVLSQSDRNDLCDGEWLNGNHVNFAQSILKRQFPHIDGWRNTLC